MTIDPTKEYLPGIKKYRVKIGDHFESVVLEEDAITVVANMLTACEKTSEICEAGDAGADFGRVALAMQASAEAIAEWKRRSLLKSSSL